MFYDMFYLQNVPGSKNNKMEIIKVQRTIHVCWSIVEIILLVNKFKWRQKMLLNLISYQNH